jgi:PAS domain S-box-containing protein
LEDNIPRSVLRTGIDGSADHDDALMRAVIDGCRDAVLITSVRGIIATSNPAAESLFGQDAAALAGRNIKSLLPEATPELDGPMEIDLNNGGHRRFELTINEIALPRIVRIHTFRDITEIKRSDEVRQTTLAEARAAAAAKAEFLHNMGHELRTPLNSVIGFSEILKDELFGPIGNEQYRQYLLAIHSCGVHLSQVINEILDVSKIEAGVYELDEESIDIGALVADAVDVSKSWEFARALVLAHDPRVNGLSLTGDRRLIRHALLDILSNAMKFSPEDGQVELDVALSDDGYLSFVVRDGGIGIDAEHLERVTDPFYQIDSAVNRKYEGAGLGLYLARAYLEFHGGEMTISSIPGSGATVTLRFPPDRVFPEEMVSLAR